MSRSCSSCCTCRSGSSTRRSAHILWACLLGGTATAFKLTGGALAVFVRTALALVVLQRARDDDLASPSVISAIRLSVVGLALAAAAVYAGIPNLLFLGPEWFTERASMFDSYSSAQGPPQEYLTALAYVSGLGLPLSVAEGASLLVFLCRAGVDDRDCRPGRLTVSI